MNAFVGLDAAFWAALLRSLVLAASVSLGALVVGWPAGVAIGLWRGPGHRLLIGLILLPLLLPSFLIAIGLSMLWRGFDGSAGVFAASCCSAVPLVMLGALAATTSLSRGQTDAARLAGGERLLYRLALRSALPFATLAAGLAGVLTLADPGPGEIFGWKGAAGEMLVSFAAQYDNALATRQALVMAVTAVLLALPVIWWLTPRLEERLLARDTARLEMKRKSGVSVLCISLASLVTCLPLAGLLRPLLAHSWPWARAGSEVIRTAGDTLLYALLAAGFSVSVGFAMSLLAGRSLRLRRLLVAGSLMLLALPPALPALWLLPWSSRFTLGIGLALRCLPLTVLFGLRAVGSMPVSWLDTARVHRVPWLLYAWRVMTPWLSRWALPAGLVAVLLATAEVGMVLLLHPPGHGTLPLAIFTIMANAPEALVAMLCLLYTGSAVAFAAMAACIKFRS